MQRLITLALCLAAAVLTSCQSPRTAQKSISANWPRFRGPNGQGHSSETGAPLNWSTNSHLAWKTEIPGEGWSSPIVCNGRIFLTSALENGTKCHVICIDAKSGAIIWSKHVFDQQPRRKEGKNSYATPTPTTDGKQVYAVFGDGSVAALTLKGDLVWTNREVQFYSRHGLGASPILYNDLLIMSYDGSTPVSAAGNYPQVSDTERTGWQIPWDKSFIAALDTTTGRRVWTGKRGMSRIAHVTSIIAKVDGQDQLISGAGDFLGGFNPKTGERIWNIYAQGEGVTPSPVIGDGMVFASSGFEKSTLRGVKLGGGKGDVTETNIAWEQKKGVPTQPSPSYVTPYLYAITDGGVATCYNPTNGEIIWQERVGGNFSASPVYTGGKIYFLSEAGETTVIEAGPQFKVLARNPLGEKCQASMAIAEQRLFIRSDKHLFCIE
ncbi:MAG TPA: PQQ-binding-like beta-propeller repeat protein [Verrucomicrobiae bacterium]